ncbi:MAG: hypothetical protein NVS1B4_11230 [Gemmatimonadaceae bacterium]
MRVFLAINLPAEVRVAIHAACAPLRAELPGEWLAPERLRLTLKFIGEISDAAATAIAAQVRPAAACYRALEIDIGGIGAFPNFRQPRIVWIGIEPDPKLELLQHDLEVVCASLGHPLEGRPFRPHVTLARLPDSWGEPERRALVAGADAFDRRFDALVDGVDVMRSEPGGSRYAVIASAPFQAT